MSDHDLTDFEKGPWSYDLYAGGLEPVGLLNDHADEAQGEWVSIEDYRKMEHERDMARATANTFRQCAEVTFGVMPFPRKFHWENAIGEARADTAAPSHDQTL